MAARNSEPIPTLSQAQLAALIEDIKDYQITHGSLLKITKSGKSTTFARPIPVSLFPTRFPRKVYEYAVRIQETFNELYAKVAANEEFLSKALKTLIRDDPFTKALWDIHLEAKAAGSVQNVALGIFRNDYMVHIDNDMDQQEQKCLLKQVEFNTMSVTGGVHTNLVADMHQYLHKTGSYGDFYGNVGSPPAMPLNRTIAGIVQGLASAHKAYGPPKSESSTRTGVLFIVQHNNFNIADERPLEYALWNQSFPIPTYRLEFRDILEHVSLGPARELLFSSPSCCFSPLEISVLYFRAGHESAEYDERGCSARLLLEKSRAIKCPSILSHLTTFKKVQQELAVPGILERFLSVEKCAHKRSTFAPLYPLDDSEMGLQARALATDPVSAEGFILKPSLEGGGHNVYGSEMAEFLKTIPKEQWSGFILMQRINLALQDGRLMSSDGVYSGVTISELGIFGTCLWKCTDDSRCVEMLENQQIGWSFKTKPEELNEMSVVKGYGFFDSPYLVADR